MNQPVSAPASGSRWRRAVCLLALWALAAGICPAYEIRFAQTGYQPTSGMSLALDYEIKESLARHEQLFKRKAPSGFKITYRIFLTRAEFEQFATASGRTVSPAVLGYMRSSWLTGPRGGIWDVEAEVVSYKHDQPAIHLSTVLHETTHAVTHAFLRQVPLWMNEGSADWFGRPAWANSDVQKTERARRWQTLKQYLDSKQLPPLREFLEADSYEVWDKLFAGNIGRGYLQGYALFDYFMAQPAAQQFLATLITSRGVELGSSPGKAFAAQLDQHWRGGLSGFERGWHEWIRSKAAAEKVPPSRKK
jgi:hypothetical protein